jgi:hypothetical protein
MPNPSTLVIVSIAVTILLVLLLVMILQNRYTEASLLEGIWKGGADFCTDSSLDVFALYMSKPSIMGVIRAYIFAHNSNGIMLNHPIDIHLSGMSVNPLVCKSRNYTCTIDWLGEDEPSFFPSEQTLTYYPLDGKLVFHDDVVYAVFYKDHDSNDQGHLIPKEVSLDSDESGVDEI